MKTLKTLSTTALAAVVAAAGATTAHAQSSAAPAATFVAAQAVQYEGTVAAVNRSARTFRIRDTERGAITVRVTSRTRFERLAGFSALRVGMSNVETTVRHSGGRWIATHVERSGGGGQHGGGNDDRGGDDHGGRGRGGDDN